MRNAFNYASTILKTIRMIYLGNFYIVLLLNCKHFANISRLHFNYAGTVSKTKRMIYFWKNFAIVLKSLLFCETI